MGQIPWINFPVKGGKELQGHQYKSLVTLQVSLVGSEKLTTFFQKEVILYFGPNDPLRKALRI